MPVPRIFAELWRAGLPAVFFSSEVVSAASAGDRLVSLGGRRPGDYGAADRVLANALCLVNSTSHGPRRSLPGRSAERRAPAARSGTVHSLMAKRTSPTLRATSGGHDGFREPVADRILANIP
jgi:hypothetical protein